MRFAVFYKKIFIKCLKPLDFMSVWGIFLFQEIDFCALFWTIKTLFSKTGMYNRNHRTAAAASDDIAL